MVLLAQVLAANDPDSGVREWGNFCQKAIGEFYKKVGYERGQKKQNFGYSSIWSYLEDRQNIAPQSAEEYGRNILSLTRTMLSSRAGRGGKPREFTEEETLELAASLRASLVSPSSREPGKAENGKLFHMGVDRGKAMHRNADIPTPWY